MIDVAVRPMATERARLLRREETDAEYRLWGELRNRSLNGYKFVRQMPIGPFFADFACRQRFLVLELDGSQHAESVADTERTRFLNARGYSVLRFWNDEVLREREEVLETILAALEGGLAPSPGLRFAPATLSPRGEEGAKSRRSAWRSAWRERARVRAERRQEAPPAPLPDGERGARAKPVPGEGA